MARLADLTSPDRDMLAADLADMFGDLHEIEDVSSEHIRPHLDAFLAAVAETVAAAAENKSSAEQDPPAVRFPDVHVDATRVGANAALVIAAVAKALRRAGIHDDVIADFRTEAKSGDYDNVIATAMAWVDFS